MERAVASCEAAGAGDGVDADADAGAVVVVARIVAEPVVACIARSSWLCCADHECPCEQYGSESHATEQ